jgi:hypothetical protein
VKAFGRRLASCALLAALCLNGLGCGDGGPTGAYRDYLSALSVADYERAFASLDRASRDALAALLASPTAAESAPAVIDPDDFRARARRAASAEEAFRVLITGGKPGGTPPLSPEAAAKTIAREIENDGAKAVLEAETALGLRRIEMRREDGRWRVSLRGL